jgi:hypothetical protein
LKLCYADDVTSTERKKWLFKQILRLRRAEREAPQSREIVAVRADLEDELGGTLAPSLAASLLGVSHTALRKWIKSGDVPLVLSSKGRREIPVGALVDLYESVREERESGRRRRHTLEPTMTTARERARSLDPKELLGDQPADTDRHRRAQLRNLAYHRALAGRLRRSTVDEAKHVLWGWRDKGLIDPWYADQWEEILAKPIPEIRRILASDEPAADDLRQNSPFAGLLSEPERRRILQEIG